MSENQENVAVGVPEQIIEAFLKQLAIDKIAPDVIVRLKDTLLKKGDLSEAAIKTALISNDQSA